METYRFGRGLFISFEGIDGSGKTTQATILRERLARLGRDVLYVREPGGTPIGETIRSELLSGHVSDEKTKLFMFMAARSELVYQVILPALASGRIVIADRFTYSTLVYQGIAVPSMRGLIAKMNMRFTYDIASMADRVTIWIDADPGVASSRSKGDALDPNRIGAVRLREAYRHVVSKDPAVRRIDGDLPVDEVAERIMEAVSPLMSESVPVIG